MPVIWKAFGSTFMFGSALKLLGDLLAFVSPQILLLIIEFIERKCGNGSVETKGTVTKLTSAEREPLWHGIFFAVALFVVAGLQTICNTHHLHQMLIVGQRIRTALIGAFYRKALTLSNAVRKESTVGEIVNLMAVDAQRFVDLTSRIHMLWSAPLQIGLALYFLWDLLGPSVLPGE